MIHLYALAKYVRLNRKDQLKMIFGTTPEVAMLAIDHHW